MSKFSIMSLKWIYNYLHKFYEYLEVNEKRMLIFLLIVCLLTQLPKAYLAYGYGESAHPGFDAALVFNGAENIKENGKYEYSVLLRYDEYDSLERHEITKPAYFYPPLTSLLLAGIFFFNDSIFATEVFQFFIFFLVIIVYFKLVKNWFDQKTAFFSAILIISGSLLYVKESPILNPQLYKIVFRTAPPGII